MRAYGRGMRFGFLAMAGGAAISCLLLAGAEAQDAAPKPASPISPRPAASAAATPANLAPSPEVYAKLKTPAGRTEFVQTFCVACHNARAKTAGLVLEGQATDQLADHDVIWEKVIKRLGAGEKPPHNAPRRPDPSVAKAMVAGLIENLDAVAAKHPYVGHTVIRRLIRLV